MSFLLAKGRFSWYTPSAADAPYDPGVGPCAGGLRSSPMGGDADEVDS